MAHFDASPSAFSFLAEVERAYTKLTESALADRDTGLGGKLLYAAELDTESRALIAAANIAGAASLAASTDRDAQKKAMRDGICDFLVARLDEALRILKNQLRKREAAAVCVGAAPADVEQEMSARGVLPDIARGVLPNLDRNATEIERGGGLEALSKDGQPGEYLESVPAILTWSVASAPAQWLPKLDAIALDCLAPDAWQARRWIRLSPRYLGRTAQGLRVVRSNREVAALFFERVRSAVDRGEIPFGFEIRSFFRGAHDEFRFSPDQSSGPS